MPSKQYDYTQRTVIRMLTKMIQKIVLVLIILIVLLNCFQTEKQVYGADPLNPPLPRDANGKLQQPGPGLPQRSGGGGGLGGEQGDSNPNKPINDVIMLH